MKNKIRKYLLAGAAVLLPLTVTFYIFWLVFGLLDKWARQLIFAFTGYKIIGAGLVAILVILLLTGLLATNYFGRKVINFWESLFLRIPLVSIIYKTTKQIMEVLSGRESKPFRQAVLIQYPRRGVFTVAFATGEVKLKDNGEQKELVCAYVCTTPNPTTGFLVLVPKEEVIYLANPVEEALQLVLSGGIVGSIKDCEQCFILRSDTEKNKNLTELTKE